VKNGLYFEPQLESGCGSFCSCTHETIFFENGVQLFASTHFLVVDGAVSCV
jgi:hypothetical protein